MAGGPVFLAALPPGPGDAGGGLRDPLLERGQGRADQPQSRGGAEGGHRARDHRRRLRGEQRQAGAGLRAAGRARPAHRLLLQYQGPRRQAEEGCAGKAVLYWQYY